MADAATTIRETVFDDIDNQGPDGATDEEIQKRLKLNPSTERPRRVELVDALRVFESGYERQTCSGRWAGVWVSKRYAKSTKVAPRAGRLTNKEKRFRVDSFGAVETRYFKSQTGAERFHDSLLEQGLKAELAIFTKTKILRAAG